jgi:Protein of unknown function (DUF3443)
MVTLVLVVLTGVFTLAGCGGGSSSSTSSNNGNNSSSGGNTIASSGPNVQPVTVSPGPPGINYVDGLFTSVTICVPGTTSCQTIDNVLVDTGSMGLRLLSSNVTLALPEEDNIDNAPIAECNQFADGYTWGAVRLADVKLASEQASSVPIQVIADPALPAIPNSCSNTGPSQDTLQDLGANGILGVGPFLQDCGGACALSTISNPGFYYACPTSSSCGQVAVSLAQQVPNPVSFFATDNNGIIIELPSVPSTGATGASGSLVFGIGTQANNGLGTAQVLTLDGYGNFSTTFKSQAYSSSYIDSGSNGLYVLDSATTGLPVCSSSQYFYCPSSTQTFSASNVGGNGVTSNVSFSIANADSLFGNTSDFAYNNLGGPNSGAFDWGLPFFLGRNVFTAIESQNTPAGLGPYFAY